MMKRSILAFLAGLLTWTLVATLINRILRSSIDGYAVVEPTMAFTLVMMVARLIMGAVASLAAGAIMKLVAPNAPKTPWVFGLLLLAAFVPTHIRLWQLFPIWYHLTFLLTLLPLTLLGWQMPKSREQNSRLVTSG